MGVQKSRKSIRYTKYSLQSLKLNNQIVDNKKFKKIVKKNNFHKNNLFFLKNRESNNYLFF